jgi:hypothetical protein
VCRETLHSIIAWYLRRYPDWGISWFSSASLSERYKKISTRNTGHYPDFFFHSISRYLVAIILYVTGRNERNVFEFACKARRTSAIQNNPVKHLPPIFFKESFPTFHLS